MKLGHQHKTFINSPFYVIKYEKLKKKYIYNLTSSPACVVVQKPQYQECLTHFISLRNFSSTWTLFTALCNVTLNIQNILYTLVDDKEVA